MGTFDVQDVVYNVQDALYDVHAYKIDTYDAIQGPTFYMSSHKKI